MNEVAGNLDGIADIAAPLLPNAADTSSIWLVVAAGCGLIALAGLFIRQRARSPRRRALRMLTQLNADHAHQPAYRDTVFRLVGILRHGLGLSRICLTTQLPGRLSPLDERWNVFIKKLYLARYAPAPCDERSLRELINECDFWLRTWR